MIVCLKALVHLDIFFVSGRKLAEGDMTVIKPLYQTEIILNVTYFHVVK